MKKLFLIILLTLLPQVALAAGSYVWTQQTPPAGASRWVDMVSSSDGQKVAAITSTGYVYTSTDGGVTWTARTSSGSRYWKAIASSADGTKLVANTGNSVNGNGVIYASTDGGATWAQLTGAPTGAWTTIASSADGTKLAAARQCASNDGAQCGHISTSVDGGATWAEVTSLGSQYWFEIASSADGTKLAATAYANSAFGCAQTGTCTYGTYIYTSTDGGVTWAQRTSAGKRNWQGIASSADGLKLVAADGGCLPTCVGGYLYSSADGGASWSQLPGSWGGSGWHKVVLSSDGTRVLAMPGGFGGYMLLSTDSGATWTEQTSLPWASWACASSADGTKFVCGSWWSNYMYTGVPTQLLQCNGTPETFSTPGTYTRAVPSYSSLTAEAWGAGGGGGASGDGNPGTASSFSTFNPSNSSVIAYGGGGGKGGGLPAPGGIGGSASGGDQGLDQQGQNGGDGGRSTGNGRGGSGANGGGPGPTWSSPGNAPGAGGNGSLVRYAYRFGDRGQYISVYAFLLGGGGGGGYSKKTYTPTTLTPNSPVTIVVGTGGTGGAAGAVWGFCSFDPTCGGPAAQGGAGANGQVKITCTANSAPATPTISGPTSGFTKTSYTYTFRSTDPDSDTIRYGIDWDDNGTVDEYVPTPGYVSSGTASSVSHSWNSANTQTFKVLAQDSRGNTSGWASHTVDLTPNGPVVLLTATPGEIGSGQSSTLEWSSSNADSCTATNFTMSTADTGYVWTQQTSLGSASWIGSAMSSSGTKIAATTFTSFPNRIVISSDGGTTWTQTAPAQWDRYSGHGMAVSADGTKMAAVNYGFFADAYIDTSTDGGASWTQQQGSRSTTSHYENAAISDDGMKLVAIIGGGNTNYYWITTSSDGGVTWTQHADTQRDANNGGAWGNVAMSSDGSKVAATVYNNYLYTSTDGGTTWTERTGAGMHLWRGLDMSPDGNKLITSGYGDYVYSSTDGGATWNRLTSAGARNWMSVAMSSDGTSMAASDSGGYVYVSNDSGATWTAQTSGPSGNAWWGSLAMSADGSRIAVGWGGYIWTGVLPSTQTTSGTVVVTPTQTTTYTVTCEGQGNQEASDTATVTYACTPVNQCSGNNVVNSCTGAVTQTCSYQCGGGACIPPPAPSFNSSGSGSTALTGHLQIRPALLKTNDRTRVFWNVSDVQSCTVLGDNTPADTWTVAGTLANNWTSTSDSAGLQSAPITERTTFTLSCTPFTGQSFTPESASVNVVPVFRER